MCGRYVHFQHELNHLKPPDGGHYIIGVRMVDVLHLWPNA